MELYTPWSDYDYQNQDDINVMYRNVHSLNVSQLNAILILTAAKRCRLRSNSTLSTSLNSTQKRKREE